MERNILALLDYEAKRDPGLANTIKRLSSMTVADIQQTKVKLPWMRNALLQKKKRQLHDDLALTADTWSRTEYAIDPLGEMRRWIGPECFIKIGRSQLLITTGQLLWLNDGMWIDSIFCKDIDSQVYRYSETCGNVTRQQYIHAVRARANALIPESATTETNTTYDRSVPFTIYRVPSG